MGEAIKGGDRPREVNDEAMVEIGETDSRLDLLDCDSWFDVMVMFTEGRGSMSDMASVNVLRLGIHEDVIQVDYHEDIGQVLEDVGHKVLKCVRHKGKFHCHDKRFNGAISNPKCGLPLVTKGSAEFIVPSEWIKFGVDCGKAQLVDKV